MSRYSKQLEDERWQKKRRKILQRDSFKCTKCGYEDNLHIHHLYYVHHKKPWQYPHNALITLCSKCHKDWHDNNEIEVRESYLKDPLKKKKKSSLIIRKIRPQKSKDEIRKEKAASRMKEGVNKKIKLIMESNYPDKDRLLKKVYAFSLERLQDIINK